MFSIVKSVLIKAQELKPILCPYVKVTYPQYALFKNTNHLAMDGHAGLLSQKVFFQCCQTTRIHYIVQANCYSCGALIGLHGATGSFLWLS